MHKRAKKGRSLYSVRDANGRFCKALSQSSAERPVEKAPVVGVEGVEKGESGEAANIFVYEYHGIDVYHHHNLFYPVHVRNYDYFTKHNILR